MRDIAHPVSFLSRAVFLLFCKIFLGSGKHQFNAVELIDFAGAGIVVDCHDVGAGKMPAQLFDDTLPDDMVWQAAEGLGADNIVYAAVD